MTKNRTSVLPAAIGRYRILRLLGDSVSAVVYCAHDDKLDREVVIKVPANTLLEAAADKSEFVAAARIAVKLDHPTIVPIYDVGETEQHPCYVVSKYVAGLDLRSWRTANSPTVNHVAELVATLADGLHSAHRLDILHGNLKPTNILVDTHDQPFVLDFASIHSNPILLRSSGRDAESLYLSPEHAWGEVHRLDGRSDVFSLGSILYELLVGFPPFHGDDWSRLVEQVTRCEPRPLRQVDENIPRELQRICQRALAERASDRYLSGSDLAQELRCFLNERGVLEQRSIPQVEGGPTSTREYKNLTEDRVSSSSTATRAIRVVPKGLRSFDTDDADFFLDLLPGPRDQRGLPESLRFWKTRIDETNPQQTFSVGMVYGPSGCGKSSFVRAGLLPRLSSDVISVFVEATADDTEQRIRDRLCESCPNLEASTGLPEAVANLRRGLGLQVGQKVLIVLDQFEQWLHANGEKQNSELVRALRQCDGGQVQCLIMLRDDFWMAATRFMDELEVDLRRDHNMQPADLFDHRHAKKVLAAFGRALGTLPEDSARLSRDESDFLEQAVAGIAEDGKVVCVRLALLAEMMKSRSWTPAELAAVGGETGVGVMFLDEMIASPAANPKLRLHQETIRAVLSALLPKSGTQIKGQMRSAEELLSVASSRVTRKQFEDVTSLLDTELRLITPTDRSGLQMDGGVDSGAQPPTTTARYYQLTHDYLVPAIRDWISRKRKESRRGRAELRLAERNKLWAARPERRHLPAWWEYLNIRLFTRSSTWTDSERRMMRHGGRHHATQWGLALAVFIGVAALVTRYVGDQNLKRAELLVNAALRARPEQFPTAVATMQPHRSYADAVLQRRSKELGADSTSGARAVLLLTGLGVKDPHQLVESIQAASRGECQYYVDALLDVDVEELLKLLNSEIASAGDNLRYQARLAIVALHLGVDTHARAMCVVAPNPAQRTTFIDTYEGWHGDLRRLYQQIHEGEESPDWRSAVCLAVGTVTDADPEVRDDWAPLLQSWYLADDALTHSAARWAMKQWEVPEPELGTERSSKNSWYVSESGQTMIRVGPGQFRQVVNLFDGTTRNVTISKPMLIADHEVTVGQFRRFLEDANYTGFKPDDWEGESSSRSPTAEHPVQRVNWYDALMFCNWLSWVEGLAPYYALQPGPIGAGGWQTYTVERLFTNGYRLPTEAEWESACRAGTTTAFACGDDKALAYRYCVCAENSVDETRPVGHKMCNAWGFFDMHGNVYEWTWGTWKTYPLGDVVDPVIPPTSDTAMSRGGAWSIVSDWCDSDGPRYGLPKHSRFAVSGFRVGRDP